MGDLGSLQKSVEIFDNGNLANDYIIQKKIEIMIEMANKKLAQELDRINNAVGKLGEEIAEIKKKLNEGVYQSKAYPPKTKPSEVSGNNNFENIGNSKKQADLKAAEKSDAVKPRYGDYKPEDVTIDKFFYFGNKK